MKTVVFGRRLKFTLTLDATDYVLDITPESNLGIEFMRSKRYHSVLRTITNNLQFKYDKGDDIIGGADLLVEEFEDNHIFGQASITIETRDTSSPITYNSFFTGILDFKTIEIQKDYVLIKAIEHGDVQKLMTRDEKNVNLNSLLSLDNETMSDFTLYYQTLINGQTIQYFSALKNCELSVIIDVTGDEDKYESINMNGDLDPNDSGRMTIPTSFNSYKLYTYENSPTISVNVLIDLVVDIEAYYAGSGNIGTWDFYARIRQWDNSEGMFINTTTIMNITGGGVNVVTTPTETFDDEETEDLNWTLDENDFIELLNFVDWDNTGKTATGDLTLQVDYTKLEILEVINTISDFNCDTIPVYEAMARALQLITSNDDPLLSSIMQRTDSNPNANASNDGALSLTQITNGFLIRGLVRKDVTMSVYKLFKSLDSIYNIGLWYNRDTEQFEINYKSTYYDSTTTILQLGEISKLKETPYIEEYYNETKAGWIDEVDYDEYSGLEEFNTKTGFSVPVENVNNVLDIQSEYRLDGFGVMLAKSGGNISKDNKKVDNYNWLIDCKQGSDFESITDEGFSTIKNVLEPTEKMNLRFSPKRSILNNSNRISPSLEYKNEQLKFLESQFNSDLLTEYPGDPGELQENENIPYAYLKSKLYSLTLYKFSFPVTELIISTLKSNPHGQVRFTYEGEYKFGFVKQVKCDYPNKQGEWLLIKV